MLPTLPTQFFGASTAAAIVATPSASHVYVSNRGHDSVAAFAVEAATGLLQPLGWMQGPGREPRFMTLHEGDLYVASERDDVIGRFAFDRRTGALENGEQAVKSLSPVSIVFA